MKQRVEIGRRVENGRVYLDAADLILALRSRAQHWDRLAEDGDSAAGWDLEKYQTACYTAAVELQDRANDLDLFCIEAINEDKDETHGH